MPLAAGGWHTYHAETIIGNCSCVLFLGGKERSTLKEISETLGKATIDSYNTSDTRGSQRSMGVNYQKLGKDSLNLAMYNFGSNIFLEFSVCEFDKHLFLDFNYPYI